MIGVLFKKQLREAFSFLLVDKKNKRARSKGSMLGFAALYVGLFAYFGVMLFLLGKELCTALVSVGLGWLYFVLMGLVALFLGVIGSVFSTYSSLYGAKDNDMLLAMPIPSRVILISRLLGVYVTGLLYELIVMIPTLIVWFVYAELTVPAVIFSLLIPLVLSFFVLTLSCLLGFGVAWISSKLRRKNLVSIVMAIAFLVLYMVFYGKIYGALMDILTYADAMANVAQSWLYPFYQMGLAARGDGIAMLIFCGIVAGILLPAYGLVAHSFLKLATANKGSASKKYVKKQAGARSAGRALLWREFCRLIGSPTYLLNCALGVVMMPVVGVVLLLYGDDVTSVFALIPGMEGLMPLIGAAMICATCSMIDTTAPSISLEGKWVWLIRSMPVSAGQVLAAKLKLQLLLAAVPTAFLTVVVLVMLRPSLAFWFLLPALAVVFTVFMALWGLFLNLKWHNLNWSNETAVVKQSLSVTLTIFGSWALVALLGLGCYALYDLLSPAVLLGICIGILTAACVALWVWIFKKGTAVFDTL